MATTVVARGGFGAVYAERGLYINLGVASLS